jgi:hypothetical protein
MDEILGKIIGYIIGTPILVAVVAFVIWGIRRDLKINPLTGGNDEVSNL